jgi:hypothetical protein
MVGSEEQVRPLKASVERMKIAWMKTVACGDHRLILADHGTVDIHRRQGRGNRLSRS